MVDTFYIETSSGGITEDHIKSLWNSVGWTDSISDKNISRLMKAIKNSPVMYAAWYNNELVGILAGMTDSFNVYISYLCVKKEYQNNNIGTHLMQIFMQDYSGYRINLMTNHAKGFYEKFGLKNQGFSMFKWS